MTRIEATTLTPVSRLLILAWFALVAGSSPGFAQSRPPDLIQMSIEDLMNIEITSASRKEQHAADVAAAVFVITQEDIRRSGMTTIPDLLRLAPGVQVAQINSNKWAVSIRGFNGLFANKLLVLVDGRSVYNRLFSGVLWDAEDLMIDDIDRIEVIRGPGAAIWGANAMNGVINIITRASADTQGTLVRAQGGGSGTQVAVRYGGTAGGTPYRVHAQWTGRDQSLIEPGTSADDASRSVRMGLRADWATQPDTFMLESGFQAGQAHALWRNLDPVTAAREPIVKDPSDALGGHVLGRWTHRRAGGATLQIQSFANVNSRQEPVVDYHRQAFDIDTQYHTALGARQDLVVGAGYRFINESFAGRVAGFSLTPDEGRSSLVTAFVQDEIQFLGNRLAVTLGSQVQYDSDSGAGVQPTARVMWKPRPSQRLWAATSRALRTPSLTDRRIRLVYPGVPTASGLPLIVSLRGNPEAETESLADVETGYRLEIGSAASIDVTGFMGRYDHLRTQEPSAPIVTFVPSPHIRVNTLFSNNLEATTSGFEVAGHWMPVRAWRLAGSYSAFHVSPQLGAASHDPTAASEDGSAARSQWQLRSVLSPGTRATISVALFHVGQLAQLQVEGYTRADVSAEWRFTSRISAVAIGQNLFDPAHFEFGGTASLLMATQVPRSVSLQLRWTSR